MKILALFLNLMFVVPLQAKDLDRIGLSVKNTINNSEIYFTCKNRACTKYNVVQRRPGKNNAVVDINSDEILAVGEIFNAYIQTRVGNISRAKGVLNSNENNEVLNDLLKNMGLNVYSFQTDQGKVEMLKSIFEKESFSIVEKMINPEFRTREKFLDPIIYNELVKVLFEE